MLAMYIFMIVLNFDYLLIALPFATHRVSNNTIINNYPYYFIIISFSYIYICKNVLYESCFKCLLQSTTLYYLFINSYISSTP